MAVRYRVDVSFASATQVHRSNLAFVQTTRLVAGAVQVAVIVDLWPSRARFLAFVGCGELFKGLYARSFSLTTAMQSRDAIAHALAAFRRDWFSIDAFSHLAVTARGPAVLDRSSRCCCCFASGWFGKTCEPARRHSLQLLVVSKGTSGKECTVGISATYVVSYCPFAIVCLFLA